MPHIVATHGWKVDQLKKHHACFKHPDMRLQEFDDIKNVLYTLRPRLYRVYVVVFCVILLTLMLTLTLFLSTKVNELTLTLSSHTCSARCCSALQPYDIPLPFPQSMGDSPLA